MTLEVSAVIGGQRTETITFTPEQLEYVAQAGKALRAGVDPATGEVLAAAPEHAPRVAQSRGDASQSGKPKRGDVPEVVHNRFRQRRGANDATYWGIGDDICEFVAEFPGHGMQAAILRAAALDTEYSLAECRKLFETARVFDQSLRDEYGDILTHQHFRVLRYVDDRAKRAAYLRLCVESADAYGGRPMPAAVLDKRVQKDLGHEPPKPTNAELLERAIRAVTNYQAVADGKPHEQVTRALEILEKINQL